MFGGRDHADAGVQAAVVVPVDPPRGGVLDIADGAVGPLVKHLGADALGLAEAVDALHQRVVIGIADAADRRRDTLQGQVFRELTAVY